MSQRFPLKSGGSSEKSLLAKYRAKLKTNVPRHKPADIDNPLDEKRLGLFRAFKRRICVTAEIDIINYFYKVLNCDPPSFPEAGPRKKLFYDPHDVRIGIVTPGGIAPGLNTVIHCLVNMHTIYGMQHRAVGFLHGFKGIAEEKYKKLRSDDTQSWIQKGGTELKTSREKYDPSELVQQLLNMGINILYVVGGDGSLTCAHKMAEYIGEKKITYKGKPISIVGIPKTMDNDILWVWHSFGFDTAVEEATYAINAIHTDARSTSRICIVQLFGRDAGFVAAHAALASGQVNAVLVPEIDFKMDPLIEYIEDKLRKKGHALVVMAEGAIPKDCPKEIIEKLVSDKGLNPDDSTNPKVAHILRRGRLKFMQRRFIEHFGKAFGGKYSVYLNQPRHLIRAVTPNSVDQIYCQRLSDLAVDNALAGYNDFMISQWLTEYVLVPLELVTGQLDEDGKRMTKKIPPHGIFWTTVTSGTGQPSFMKEHETIT